MTNLLTIFIGVLLIKAVILMLPTLIRTGIRKHIPYKKYTAEEVIACKHMKPDLYYQKQLNEYKNKHIIKNEDISFNFSKSDKEIQLLFLKELISSKLKNKQLTRSKVLAIRNFLEYNLKTESDKNKKFANDFHAIYHYLKSSALTSEHISAITNLIK
ncbi:hypothetical protein [uncultured Clostridium sp.]|jgi:hypothetical protein|uniref:hypothetical protein n=1 Tax=uncultured Clostridium sp. TaxID=59620 RepID=UPI0025F807C8|nr:hypothetical protein [uncultured Clostridium sp.]